MNNAVAQVSELLEVRGEATHSGVLASYGVDEAVEGHVSKRLCLVAQQPLDPGEGVEEAVAGASARPVRAITHY